MCADFAIHDKGTGNPHVHIMLTLRPLKENGQWGAKCRKAYDCLLYTSDIDIPEQPVRVRLDMDSYMRIVNNLIQNVIAHSHADKIKIVLSKKENNMELLLADNGVGIEKDDLKHIFERLYKCDKAVSYTHLDVYKRQALSRRLH